MNRIRSAAILCLVAHAGCTLDTAETTTTPEPLPLAELAGGLTLDRIGADLQLSIQTTACLGIEDAVTARLDGMSANVIERGGTTVDDCSELGHCDTYCVHPRFTWSRPVLAGGASTFEIADGITTWTFEVDQPTVPRTLERTSPVGTTLHVGEVVTIQLHPSGGTTSHVYATAPGLFTLEESTGLTRTGTGLEFAIPPVSAGAATLEVGAQVALPVLTCSAPGGCTAVELAQSIAPVTFAP